MAVAAFRLKVKELVDRAMSRMLTGPVVLMYHRVADVDSDPWGNAVSPANFEAHLRVLRKRCRVRPLETLCEDLGRRELPPNGVAVTFDDGYYDNLANAKPLCEKYEVPATVFVSTGSIGAGREFWWDELQRLLLEPGTLPAQLVLRIGERTHRWSLGSDAVYATPAYRACRSYRYGDRPPTRRHAVYAELYALLRDCPAAQRDALLEQLRQWAGLPPSDRRLAHPMTDDEVRELARGSLIEVGAHAVTHRPLTDLPLEDQRVEIEQSKQRLEELTGRPVCGFAYPHGSFSGATAGLVRQAGFRYACTVVNQPIRVSSSPFELPRVYVKNWNAEEFARRLARHLDLAG